MSSPKSPLSGLAGGSDFNSNGRKRNNNKKIRPTTTRAYKYTTPDRGLAEEIYLKSEGKIKFLLIDPKTEEPELCDSINLVRELFTIVRPQEINVTNPNQSLINPYILESEDEVRHLIQVARRLDISDLFSLVEYVWKNVVVAKENELITLLTNYTLYSYFQDQFETLHYILLTGPPGWGKGAILVTFKLLGYRVVMAGDMSGANLLDLMGTLERCQLSLAEGLVYKVNVSDPIPPFVIWEEDMPLGLVMALEQLGEVSMNRAITNVVRRIYESVDPEYFHTNGIYGKIRWRFAP